MNRDPIITHYVHPPIPIRDWDWCAYRDPESKLVGWGRTEAEARADFARLELEDACYHECNNSYACQFSAASGGRCPLETRIMSNADLRANAIAIMNKHSR